MSTQQQQPEQNTTEKFSMTPEQSFVFANQGSPVYLAPAFGAAAAFEHNLPQVKDAFRTGEGVAWGDQTQCLSCAVARFFRPGYANHLARSWLPALNGVVEKLELGGEVADVGCGHDTFHREGFAPVSIRTPLTSLAVAPSLAL